MPKRPKKPCAYPGCPKLTDGRYCDEHKKLMDERYNRYERPYKSEERYGAEWRRVRNLYIKAHPLCEECLKEGKYTAAELVHHIKPINEGGTNADENLMSLCASCHGRIHAERGDRWHNKGK